ncbi:hypothetical protein HRI_001750800 [Hibiscus trionum]|uniref:RRM domain-containing protein n=1 Tax=Hibiscus trionum TaxID=183268 RepID=A0A9W7HRU9_HIBTR|nr:hypothetical protein HRI_001750800 [Hibiscus trionum]
MERGCDVRERGFTLYVENIPKATQWKGLWHAFARHGDVVDAYIAGKLSRGGRKFGFVRFRSKDDAVRAIERLNGFALYGFRLSVSMARFKTDPQARKWSTQGCIGTYERGVNRSKTFGKGASPSDPRKKESNTAKEKNPTIEEKSRSQDKRGEENPGTCYRGRSLEDEEMSCGRDEHRVWC